MSPHPDRPDVPELGDCELWTFRRPAGNFGLLDYLERAVPEESGAASASPLSGQLASQEHVVL